MQISYTNFLDWQRESESFEHLGTYQCGPAVNVSITGRPETAFDYSVSHGIFDALGVQPVVGRSFLPEEDQPGRKDVVILSHDFWRSRFSGDLGVIEKQMTIDYRTHGWGINALHCPGSTRKSPSLQKQRIEVGL